jgi:D-tyrosyl-tRNA(Tyr) deacylase
LIAVIQRAKSGSVTVNEKIIGKIDHGFVILLGVSNSDEEKDADYLAHKIAFLRLFNDENEKMNLSIQDVGGSALVISQFTLCGDTSKGRRPSFIHAAHPEKGNALYKYFMKKLKEKGIPVESGEFGAMMNVAFINEGPVTFILESNQVKSE